MGHKAVKHSEQSDHGHFHIYGAQRTLSDSLFYDGGNGLDQFVTVFFGVLQTDTGKMIYSNAGHNPAYVLHANNGEQPESLPGTGIPLGMFEEMEWEQEEHYLLQGDTLLMYTDGVTEAQDISQALYDDDRLLSISRANVGRSAEDIRKAIIQSISDFVGDAPQFDDITLVVAVRT